MKACGANEKRDHRRERYGTYRALEGLVVEAQQAAAGAQAGADDGHAAAPTAGEPPASREDGRDSCSSSSSSSSSEDCSLAAWASDPGGLKRRAVHFVLRCCCCGTMWTRDKVSAINIDHVHVELMTKGARPKVYTKGAPYGADAAAV